MKKNTRLKAKLLIISLISFMLLGCGEQRKSSFDIVCDHFDALEKHPNLANMSKEERFDFVDNLVNQSLKPTDDAYETWKLLSTNTKYRYSLFKDTTIEITGKPLSCPSMERLSSTVEEKIYTQSNDLPPNVKRMKDATWD